MLNLCGLVEFCANKTFLAVIVFAAVIAVAAAIGFGIYKLVKNRMAAKKNEDDKPAAPRQGNIYNTNRNTAPAEEKKSKPVIEEKVEEPIKEEPAPVVEEKVEEPIKEEPAPVVEEKVEEPVKEEPAPVVEEKKAPAKKEKKAPVKKEAKPVVAKKAEPAKKAEKPAAKKEEPAKKAEKAEDKAKKSAGKWNVEKKSDDEYVAVLYANNGQCMLTSEIYTTEEGARNGIATIVNNVENGTFVTYKDKNDNSYFKLKNANNRLLCVGEIYKNAEQCSKAMESVKRLAPVALINPLLVEGTAYVDYTPIKDPVYEAKKGTLGKWIIEQVGSGKYSAKLFASNGQLMLATEEVATKKSATNSIESVKKNSAEGNFIVDRDKFGRFYYKLRNAQKSVICIGEAYDTLDSCTSALESVRRFAATAVLVNDKKEEA